MSVVRATLLYIYPHIADTIPQHSSHASSPLIELHEGDCVSVCFNLIQEYYLQHKQIVINTHHISSNISILCNYHYLYKTNMRINIVPTCWLLKCLCNEKLLNKMNKIIVN